MAVMEQAGPCQAKVQLYMAVQVVEAEQIEVEAADSTVDRVKEELLRTAVVAVEVDIGQMKVEEDR